MNFLQDDLEKIRRKSKENYGVSVNSLWRSARCAGSHRDQKGPPQPDGRGGHRKCSEKQSGAELGNGGLHAGQSLLLASMAARSVPPPGVR